MLRFVVNIKGMYLLECIVVIQFKKHIFCINQRIIKKMLLSTRDAQRDRATSVTLATNAIADRLNLGGGIDNASFQAESTPNLRVPSVLSSVESQIQIQPQPLSTIIDTANEQTSTASVKQSITSLRKRYSWRMTHYFYIHISLFIVNGLFCGLIVYLIENYSSVRNLQIEVYYVDAWFVSSSCVYNCGLTSLDFAKLSHASQIVLMIFTFISGITISTLPALVVKAYTHKNVEGITVDDDHDDLDDDADELPTFNARRRRNLPQHIRDKIAALPTAAQLRYRAYITCIALILGTCFAIYSIIFVAIGGWLSTQYTSDQLLQGNYSINPWYISFIVTVTGFNQNGLTPFSDGFERFIYDAYLNLFVMAVNEFI
jgi:hypothetical protein